MRTKILREDLLMVNYGSPYDVWVTIDGSFKLYPVALNGCSK